MSVPSKEQIDAAINRAGRILSELQFVPEYTIDDYPIGSRNRGKCRLQVEWKKGKGYRTVRTTTDKHGRWCAPKCSTYNSLAICVVTGNLEHDAGWLRCDSQSIYVQSANGNSDNGDILKKPEGLPYSPPRRKREEYDMISRDIHGVVINTTHHVLEPDASELIEAWDHWVEGFKALYRVITEKAKNANEVLV